MNQDTIVIVFLGGSIICIMCTVVVCSWINNVGKNNDELIVQSGVDAANEV